MKKPLFIFCFLSLAGLYFQKAEAQLLVTKCPSQDWFKHLETCYLPVGFNHSWYRGSEYCQKFGAKLAEPKGYVISGAIGERFKTSTPWAKNFWIGYWWNDTAANEDASVGFWSDDVRTSAAVGVWGAGEPDLSRGHCASISTTDMKWYMNDCAKPQNFFCEVDPCPAGDRDTFMCNGKCLAQNLVCNGVDDCGNNEDEIDCENFCSKELTGTRGTFTVPVLANSLRYEANMNCTWTIRTAPNKRITVTVHDFSTEEESDCLEFWENGVSLETSEVSARLCGQINKFHYISSYNFLILRFISDESIQSTGFTVDWNTEFDCSFVTLEHQTVTDSSIYVDPPVKLASLQPIEYCENQCRREVWCTGFRYETSTRKCYFMSSLPVLTERSDSTMYMRSCTSDTTIQGNLPMIPSRYEATSSPQVLPTPRYPSMYVGNLELEYTIYTQGNNLIMLEVLSLELCCGDTIELYNADGTSLAVLDWQQSAGMLMLSTSNTVYIFMVLKQHWQCTGGLIRFTQGCNVSLIDSGTFSSPGIESLMYPNLMSCTWTVLAPTSNRSVTVFFDVFDIHQTDTVEITFYNGTTTQFTGTSLQGRSLTSQAYLMVSMFTSSLEYAKGFSASFSPGCPPLGGRGYQLTSTSFNYGDSVTLSCDEGFQFTGDNAGLTSITVECQYGGHWNMDNIPICARGICNAPVLIPEAIILSSTGSLGGDETVYACKSGYTLIGNNVVTCLANNSRGALPTCISTEECLHATLLPDVNVSVLLGDGKKSGSVIHLSCNESEEIMVPPLSQCLNGNWDFLEHATPSVCAPIPCGTPLINNAVLSPPPPYYNNSVILATCVDGYALNGDPTFECGSGPLPSCHRVECDLSDFPHVVRVDMSDDMIVPYGYSVNVTCDSGYYLNTTRATWMILTCTASGYFHNVPECGKRSCGIPYQVPGSVYSPTVPCKEHGCRFTFGCGNAFVLKGASSHGNVTVECGHVFDGLWGFNEIRCEGGQCSDLDYPANGALVGDSFESGAHVTFVCNLPGYSPLEDDGKPSTGMTCEFNEEKQLMEWKGKKATCNDTMPPVISFCGDGSFTYAAGLLTVPTFNDPRAMDNTGVKSWEVFPENFRSTQPVKDAETITYLAQDYAGNIEMCRISIIIPNSIACKTDVSTSLPLSTNTTFFANDTRYFEQKDLTLDVVFSQTSFLAVADVSTLKSITEITVESRDNITQEVVDTCTLQFKFIAPACSFYALDLPNAHKNCSGLSCTITCDTGHYFMHNASLTSVIMTCNGSSWDKVTPVCAATNSQNVMYSAAYNFKYALSSPGSQSSESQNGCIELYKTAITEKLNNFESAMEKKCNDIFTTDVNLTLVEETISVSYSSLNRVNVRFEFRIDLEEETVSNSAELKKSCAEHIQTSLNTETDIETIDELLASSSPNCSGGLFDLPSESPVFQYKCPSSQRFTYLDGQGVCLYCPLGYQYIYTSSNISHQCQECPDGTYGASSADGTGGFICERCPNNRYPGLTGLKSPAACEAKESCKPGYFSVNNDGLSPCKPCPKSFYNSASNSRTCKQCDSNQITFAEASKSSIDCKIKEQADDDGRNYSCKPNPCKNGGNCTLVRRDYFCTCPEGYTGQNCTETIDACSSKPCANLQECRPVGLDDFICGCNFNPGTQEFSGKTCNIDNYGCSAASCKNNGTCHNQPSNSDCKCPSYSGYINDGTCGTKLDPCTVDPCQNGFCIPHGHFYKSCYCNDGWTGLYCETNIDDCVGSLCENGAVCIDGLNSFNCSCPPNYHGTYCQFYNSCSSVCEDSTDSECNSCMAGNTGSCIPYNNDYICNCLPGYSGRFCETMISQCSGYPCKHGGTCSELGENDYTCDCPELWEGKNCQNYVDNCGNQCMNGGTCHSTASSYVCECPYNYIGDHCEEKYDLCERANPCVGEGSNCTSTEAKPFQCSCAEGREGDICENVISQCNDNVCQNGGTCVDINDPNPCVCPSGYEGSHCQTNEHQCASNPCPENKVCDDEVSPYECKCAVGMRGRDCDKVVRPDFDYVIIPHLMCQEEASMGIFGNGTSITELTVAFWVRATRPISHDELLVSVFGSVDDSPFIPEDPSFIWQFTSKELFAYADTSSNTRKRRETTSLPYFDSPVNDTFWRYWHHVAVTWSSDGEITLYIDGIYREQRVFSEDHAIASRGFFVFGDYDEQNGLTVPSNSVTGRFHGLYILGKMLAGSEIESLYRRELIPDDEILQQERSTMLLYQVDYNSEIVDRDGYCTTIDSCPPLHTTDDLSVEGCPDDIFNITERGVAPNWTDPKFTGSTLITNVIATDLEWGVYGVVYASFNSAGSAAVCAFRVYNYGVGCGNVRGQPYNCTDIDIGGVICQDQCPNGQDIPGITPLYQTCSMYGMWDEAVKYSYNINPDCSDVSDLMNMVQLSLTAYTNDTCNTQIVEDYEDSVFNILQLLDNLQDFGRKLCSAGDNCVGLKNSATFECDGDDISVHIDFGSISSTLKYEENSIPVMVTTKTFFDLMVGDFGVFTYFGDESNNYVMIAPDLTSYTLTNSSICPAGYMITGSNCVKCGRGTYYDEESRTCMWCPKGTYRSNTADPVSQCVSCFTSNTTLTVGATDPSYCVASCLPGQYYRISSSQAGCVSCAIGFYQDVAGEPYCKPCPSGLTTANPGANSLEACVDPITLTTTPSGPGPNIGAVSEDTGFSVGVIVAIVLAVLLFILLLILTICFCFCRDMLPCLSKKKQVVSPLTKDGYYAKKYGDPNMQFVSYNLKDIREKKGKPIDRVPIVEPQLSDETGSVKTDISVHVPVFNEKMNGKVTRKALFMSNGGQSLNASLSRSGRTPRDPMTSSPRDAHYYGDMDVEAYENKMAKRKRRKKRHRGERGSPERTHRRQDRDDEYQNYDTQITLPKALAPMPQRLKSTPPEQVILRPSSALEQPRVKVEPSHYEDFLEASPSRQMTHVRSPQSYHDHDRSHDRERSHDHERLHDRERSHDRQRADDMERSQDYERSRDRKRRKKHRNRRAYEDDWESSRRQQEVDSARASHVSEQDQHIYRIEVESDEDLR